MELRKTTIVLILSIMLVAGCLTIVPEKAEAVAPSFYVSGVSQTSITVTLQAKEPEGDTGLSSVTCYYIYRVSTNNNNNYKVHHVSAAQYYQSGGSNLQVDPQSTSFTTTTGPNGDYIPINPGTTYYLKVGYSVGIWEPGLPFPSLNECQFIGNIYGEISATTSSSSGSPPPSGSPPASCPYVSVWDGDSYETDNSMLLGNDIDTQKGLDPYMLTKTPVTDNVDGNEYYKILIDEREKYETTYLDEMGMFAIDHPSNTSAYVNDEQEVITYSDPGPPISAFDNNGTDQLTNIQYPDELFVDGDENDTLIVEFDDVIIDNLKLVVVSDMAPCSGQSPISLPNEEGPVDIEFLSSTEEWVHVDFLFPRSYWSVDVYDMSADIPMLHDPLTIKFTWYSYHKIDSVGIDLTASQPYELVLLKPYTYTFSNGNIDVLPILETADNNELEIDYNESVEALFIPPAESSFNERSFGVYLYGYYENWGLYNNINIEAVQDVSLELKVLGHTKNMIQVDIYEDESLILSEQISANKGKEKIVLIPFERILDKEYSVELSYSEFDNGANTVFISLIDQDNEVYVEKAKLKANSLNFTSNIDDELSELNAESKLIHFRAIEKEQPIYLTISEYNWDFGDGQVSNDAEPYHSFEYGIQYFVSLSVEYSNDDVSTFVSHGIIMDFS